VAGRWPGRPCAYYVRVPGESWSPGGDGSVDRHATGSHLRARSVEETGNAHRVHVRTAGLQEADRRLGDAGHAVAGMVAPRSAGTTGSASTEPWCATACSAHRRVRTLVLDRPVRFRVGRAGDPYPGLPARRPLPRLRTGRPRSWRARCTGRRRRQTRREGAHRPLPSGTSGRCVARPARRGWNQERRSR
jgi:hypothetical protein